jgi:hypothetical protein
VSGAFPTFVTRQTYAIPWNVTAFALVGTPVGTVYVVAEDQEEVAKTFA